MEQEINDSTIEMPDDCCESPKYPEERFQLTPKLHQSRGYIEARCENCDNLFKKEYYHDKKVADGKHYDKDAMDIGSGDCDHFFGTNSQTAVITANNFYVRSTCKDCNLVVEDIFEPM